MLASGQWLKSNETSSVMEPYSNLCQLPAEIAVWFHHTACFIAFKPVTTDQHPYMQVVSVLCKPVNSMPTSLSFYIPAHQLGYPKIVSDHLRVYLYNLQSISLNPPPVNPPPRLWLGCNSHVTTWSHSCYNPATTLVAD